MLPLCTHIGLWGPGAGGGQNSVKGVVEEKPKVKGFWDSFKVIRQSKQSQPKTLGLRSSSLPLPLYWTSEGGQNPGPSTVSTPR